MMSILGRTFLSSLILFWLDSGGIEANFVQKLPDIYWNTSNPIFRIDNTDHIIDVTSSTHGYDQVNIICPLYYKGSSDPAEVEKFIIYSVNKEEYDTCHIRTKRPRIIAQCTTPFELQLFTISFRSFSPSPMALEYKPGKDYYFISTASKADMLQRADGMCRDFNTKVVFKVRESSPSNAVKKEKNDEAAESSSSSSPSTWTSSTSFNPAPSSATLNPVTEEEPLQVLDDDDVGGGGKFNEAARGRNKGLSKSQRRKNRRRNQRKQRQQQQQQQHQRKDVQADAEKGGFVKEKEMSYVEKVNTYMMQEKVSSSATTTTTTTTSGIIFNVVLFIILRNV